MKYDRWKISEPAEIRRPPDADSDGLPPIVHALLSSRGYRSESEMRAFIDTGSEQLTDPLALTDMAKACERIEMAIRQKEKVAVYGDYDVDGITSSCMLTHYLRSRGLECKLYIPDRLSEGYGLNTPAISALAEGGATLIITVDCGITSIDEVEFARELGVDVVITDHHECKDELPNAVAVVDPKRGEPGDIPVDSLAGVGVAFKLICALEGSAEHILERYGDLVALGTIADVMLMSGENRYLTRRGMELINTAPRPGIAALIREANLSSGSVMSHGLGFALAPRLNAAARLDSAELSARLILSEDADEAEALAKRLCELNRERQLMEAEIQAKALEMLGDTKPNHPVVLAGENWHQGVVGIVASRLAEQLGVPVAMISLDGEEGRGSCRSSGNFNFYLALEECSELLERYGGHALAAGLTIRRENIGSFAESLAQSYAEDTGDKNKVKELDLDFAVCEEHLLNFGSVNSLDLLEPFGNGNPRPALCIMGARLTYAAPIGGGRHLRIGVSVNYSGGSSNIAYDCVFFGCSIDDLNLAPGDMVDIAFTPQINDFRNRKTVQLSLLDIRASDESELCERLLTGGRILRAETHRILPKRRDFAAAWRALSDAGGELEGERDELLELLCGKRAFYRAKLCLCLVVFAELELLTLEYTDGALVLSCIDGAPHVNLDDSRILSALREKI